MTNESDETTTRRARTRRRPRRPVSRTHVKVLVRCGQCGRVIHVYVLPLTPAAEAIIAATSAAANPAKVPCPKPRCGAVHGLRPEQMAERVRRAVAAGRRDIIIGTGGYATRHG